MSLLSRVIKLAQELDSKGLRDEADVLDKFALTLDLREDSSGSLELSDENLTTDNSSMQSALLEIFQTHYNQNISERNMSHTDASEEAMKDADSIVTELMDSGIFS
tara:strand:+ start:456 stop:773 length:318 start_codon:yes stop_codon:yes gene_type:complete